jgi:hypothetical protein
MVASPGTLTAPAGYTRQEFTSYTGPSTSIEVSTVNSGQTDSGVTYGSVTNANYGAVAAELFSSVAYTHQHTIANAVTFTATTSHTVSKGIHLTHVKPSLTLTAGTHITTVVTSGAGSSLYGVAVYGVDVYGATVSIHVYTHAHVKANISYTAGTNSFGKGYFLQHSLGAAVTGTWDDPDFDWDDVLLTWDGIGSSEGAFIIFAGKNHSTALGHVNPPATYVLIHTRANVSVQGKSHTPVYQQATPPGVYTHQHVVGKVFVLPGQHTFDPPPGTVVVPPPTSTANRRGELHHAVNQKDSLRGVRQSGQRLVRQRRP